jgi:golgi to ER traffic protein 4
VSISPPKPTQSRSQAAATESLKPRISEGNFYEAHQQLRVVASRYVKASDYVNAADILSNGAVLLLNAGQGGSGGDLSMMLLNDVYNKGEWECNEANKNRLVEILKAFPREEPTRKRFVQEMIGWSGKFGELDRGDPDLHHAAGAVYAEEGEAYEAERHLLLGTPASVPILANLHYIWYAADSPHLAATYTSRSVFPYLVLGNLASATRAYQLFTSRLTSKNPQLFTQSIESSKSEVRVFPSLPLLNFLSLLLLTCQKGDSALFKQLAKHYAVHLKETEDMWGEALANIGEIWFGIRIPKGGNPLIDMMGSMFFGGAGAGQKPSTPRSSTPKPKPEVKNVEPAPAAAMDLD